MTITQEQAGTTGPPELFGIRLNRRNAFLLGGAATGIAIAATRPWRFLFPETAEPNADVAKTDVSNPNHIAQTIKTDPALRASIAGFMGIAQLPEGFVQEGKIKDPKGVLPDTPATNYHIVTGLKQEGGRVMSITTLPAALAGSFREYEAYLDSPEAGAAREVWGQSVTLLPDTEVYYNSTGRSVLGFTNVNTTNERKFQLFMDGNPNFTALPFDQQVMQWNTVTRDLLNSGALG